MLNFIVLSCIAAKPDELRIGAMFPMFKTKQNSYGKDGTGIARFAAFYEAVNEINANTVTIKKIDGQEQIYHCGGVCPVAEQLLPATNISFAFEDSKRDEGAAIFGAMDLIRRAFSNKGIHAIVGAASSGPSKNVALISKFAEVPQLSYSSTSADLSASFAYPYFFRAVPSDAFQGIALADLVKNKLGWENVATASSDDSYGSAGIGAFIKSCSNYGIKVLASPTFPKDSTNYAEVTAQLAASGARVFVIFSQYYDAGRLVKAMSDAGIAGPGYTIIGSDAALTSKMWRDQDAKFTDDDERKTTLKGLFGVVPSSGFATKNAVFDDWVTRHRVYDFDYREGGCSNATDSRGKYIWQQDEDQNPATPNKCSGFNSATLSPDGSDINSYAPYAYDSVFAIAKAVHELVEVDERATISGPEIKAILLNATRLSFKGVTGVVEFSSGEVVAGSLVNQGDREVGIKYQVLNFGGDKNEQGEFILNTLGFWTPRKGCQNSAGNFQNCFEAVNGALWKYSTPDNSKPPDFEPRVVIINNFTSFKDFITNEQDVVVGYRSSAYTAFAFNRDRSEYSGNIASASASDPYFSLSDTMLEISELTRTVVIAMASIGIVLSITTSAVYYRYRNLRLLKISSRPFLTLSLLASILGYVSAIMFVLAPSEAVCIMRPLIFNLGFSGLLGPLFTKTYRVYKIFHNPNLKRVKIKPQDLYLVAGSVVFCNICLLAIWFVADYPKYMIDQISYNEYQITNNLPNQERLVEQKVARAGNSNEVEKVLQNITSRMTVVTVERTYQRSCTGQETIYPMVLAFYFVGILVVGSYLSYKTRHVPSTFNESSSIGGSIYFMVMIGPLFVGLNHVAASPNLAAIIRASGAILGMFTVWCFLHVPKMLMIAQDPTGTNTFGASMGTTSITDTERKNSVVMERMAESAKVSQLNAQIKKTNEHIRHVIKALQQTSGSTQQIKELMLCLDDDDDDDNKAITNSPRSIKVKPSQNSGKSCLLPVLPQA